MGKQLLLDTFRGKKTERVPWVPFVGCHGGKLIGVDAGRYLKSGELIAEGVMEAVKLYQPDGIPITFDLQIEAEALGCGLRWAEENPPAVETHVLETGSIDELPTLTGKSGRIPEVIKAIQIIKAESRDVALYGLITGPFTLALHLKGANIFMEMYDDPEGVKRLMDYCTGIARKMAGYYLDAGCDIIALVDPMTSQISPEAFREFVTPWATAFFDAVRKRGALSSFFVCGHAQKNIEAMCETGPDNVSIDENIDLEFVRDVCREYQISFGGNLQLTVGLLMGNKDDVSRNVVECMEKGGNEGFILAPGCDLPFNVPFENIQTVAELVHDPYQYQVARALVTKQRQQRSELDMTEYGQENKVIVDIITLDSEACAPCQYMVEAVKKVIPQFKDIVVWREHKIKEKESVEFMMGLMVKNVPTICIDGQITFVSTIPAPAELAAAIQKRINEKMHIRIREQRNRLLILTGEDDEGRSVWENAQQAALELGSTVEIVHIQDEESRKKYGIAAAPAVITMKQQIKSVGHIPSVEVIKEWLKDLK